MKNDEPTAPDALYKLIGETLAKIDRAGRPWDGWRKSLTEDQRQRLKEIEHRIDSCCLGLDRAGVVAALEEYLKLTIDHKEETQCRPKKP